MGQIGNGFSVQIPEKFAMNLMNSNHRNPLECWSSLD